MLRQARTAAAAQIAAVLVAVTLSGVPRVASLHAPAQGHVCTCGVHARGHKCTCVLCRQTALAAVAFDRELPQRYRDAAREQLQADERGAPGAPCVDGTCGDGAQPQVTVAGVEPFCLPSPTVLAVALAEERRPAHASAAPERALEPETPPPRAA